MNAWIESLKVYYDRRMLTLLALGFSSGLPAPLVFSNLSIWLRDEGVSRTDIGLFALATTPYAINFLWAPLVDRMPLPWLTARFGRRRGWTLFAQGWLILAIGFMALTDPSGNLMAVAVAALFVAFVSATQDIVIDAYRIDVLEPHQYGAGSAAAIWGWHLGGTLVGGAGGLYLASAFGWNVAYGVLAFAIGIGVLAILLSPEPTARPTAETVARERRVADRLHHMSWLRGRMADLTAWFYGAVVAPFADFMRRDGWVLILVFIFVFKFGDALLGRMSGVFYREMGFALVDIANVSKVYGLAANGVGIVVGGYLVFRLGVMKSLFFAGFAAASTNLTYSWLAMSGHDMTVFKIAVMSDNFTGGLATVAFVAYLSSLTNVAYTATQYALLASLGNLARIWLSASSGWMVDQLDGDWAIFFAMTAGLALAGLPLLLILMWRFPTPAPKRVEPPD
ncbi:AmpG family muropeptide MFS transporter [Thioalkalivibrio thiocyanodenitrificans]|uniref:AmpG family muropeptide MFS transporter n=1 Tax=Thioalkalivibrio thiocyanodenitrificans TaxID=243063 RepID=UPI0003776BD6|nr:MFS transporter [Thioalkalivibrio thiocyanodenitrificans]